MNLPQGRKDASKWFTDDAELRKPSPGLARVLFPTIQTNSLKAPFQKPHQMAGSRFLSDQSRLCSSNTSCLIPRSRQ